jgi:hypothetical protein
MPHSKSELAGGLLQTALHLFKNSNYLNGFTLFFKALWYFHAHVLLFSLKILIKNFSGFLARQGKRLLN